MKKTAVMFLILTFGLVAVDAQATVWKQDPVHSQVKFGVTHLVISEVDGNFKDFDVTLSQLNPDFSGSTLEANIKTASISTDNDMRDKHLRSDDFLNAEKFPSITFKSTSFEKTGDNEFKISGNLTIRDVTKPVVLTAKFMGELTDARGVTKAGFKATGSISRFDYGVKWNKAVEAGGLVVSDKVDITLLMEMQKQK
jgi:polyisoprenoid-binding protein YceI